MNLKAVYVICSAIYQMVMIAGGSFLTFSGGNGWWLAGGIFFALTAGTALSDRMNKWGD